MSRPMKFGVFATVVVVVAGGLFFLTAAKRNNKAVQVRLQQVARKNLTASVTASGQIDAKTSVDISADITGRITKIGVREGDLVQKGQFLLQIDPTTYQAAVSRSEALVASNEANMVQTRATMDQAKRAWDRAQEMQKAGQSLISPEAVEQAETSYNVAQANYNAARAQVQQARASLQEAKDNLSKTRLVAPMSGRVVRLAVEEGEVAVPGTFSRETGLLMTIADLSVILAKVKVDETDIVRLKLGDSVQVTIDALPDTSFVGEVTKISNSARLTSTQTSSGSSGQAVDFDVEVTLRNPPPDIRPDLSCTAKIITDTRKDALSIPIIALTVRDHAVVPNESVAGQDTTAKAKQTKETEGVFVVRDGMAFFQPVKIGITGEEDFEVLNGLKPGETIVAGSYQAIRDLKDSTRVRAMQGAADTMKAGGK